MVWEANILCLAGRGAVEGSILIKSLNHWLLLWNNEPANRTSLVWSRNFPPCYRVISHDRRVNHQIKGGGKKKSPSIIEYREIQGGM